MTRFVLDASAVLADVFHEPGADVVLDALESGAVISAVNAEEVASKLHGGGWKDEDVALVFEGIEIVPFDARHALLSGRYRPVTRSLGLGLGDRACLATATLRGWPALTADRAWVNLDVGAEIVCIR
ncbi:MAG: type II toxin-antitoxin system VapC family toxin [Gammaproteobacteria bacterium]|nr:type II toxin-antitoxin system VapC family toxin [Gammaproteobacteria bacterium]